MKKQVLFIFTTTLISFSGLWAKGISDKFRISILATPGVSWTYPQGKDMRSAGAGFSATYGLGFDYFFSENYAVSTGLFGGFEQGILEGRNAFDVRDPVSGNLLFAAPNEKYSFHNLDFPIYLKLRTNEFSRFRVFGQIGIRNAFTLASRGTFNAPIYNGTEPIEVIKENMSTTDNPVNRVIGGFKSLWYDIKLSAGIGAEYFFNSRQSIQFGVMYHNGFLNRIRDNDPEKDKVLMRNIELLVGFTF
jgi:hypothetical protein